MTAIKLYLDEDAADDLVDQLVFLNNWM